jgi:ankyrin repeat protein
MIDEERLDRLLGIRLDGSVDLERTRLRLVKHPWLLESRDGGGYPPLSRAVYLCHPGLAALLIGLGADVHTQPDDGFPYLYRLVDERGPTRDGALKVAALLLDAGADVNQRGVNDWTPLHRAARHGYLDMVRLLAERGADVNARTRCDEFYTPLMEAAAEGQVAVIEYLLSRGADPTLVSLRHQTAEQIAEESNHPEAARELRTFRAGQG